MDAAKITIKHKIIVAVICSILFSVVYNFSAWYTSTLANVPSFVFSFEKHIPFIPITILPYITSGFFFCTVFFLCKNYTQLITLGKRLSFIIVVAGIFYFLFPLQFSLQKPATENPLFQFLFQFIKTVDSPYNQAPSLHIAFAFTFWTVFKNLKKWRVVFVIWLTLLGLSTLTTYQHHLIDVLLGTILAQASFVIFPLARNSFQFRNFHIANYYFLGGWSIVLLSVLLYEFINPTLLILLWPSVVFFTVGYRYQKNSVHFLKDKSGSISLFKKVFYFPYLAIYWLLWSCFRKNTKVIEVLSKLYISSRLNKQEINNFKINKNTLVYDFSAELEEHQSIKENAQYFSVPMLDVGAFNIDEIKKIVLEISKKYKELPSDGKILIHCTMGYTRSTFIAILVIKNILSSSIEEATQTIQTKHKNAVIHTFLRDFLKTLNI